MALCTRSPVAAGGAQATVAKPARYLASSLAAQAATNAWRRPGHGSSVDSGSSQHLRKQSAVMTIEAATTLWPCGGLCLEEVRHMDVKIA